MSVFPPTRQRYKIAVICPVNTPKYNDTVAQAIAPILPPDFGLDVYDLTAGIFGMSANDLKPSVESRTDAECQAYPVVKAAKKLEEMGYHGLWMSCFSMCGVEAAREIVDIPILGGFSACAFTALALSQRFSVISINPPIGPMIREWVAAYGMQDTLASIRSLDEHVPNVAGSSNSMAEASSSWERIALTPHMEQIKLVAEVAEQAVLEDEAHAILLGCTGFVDVAGPATERLQQALAAKDGSPSRAYVPIIDPNQAGISMLVSFIRMNIRPSRRTYAKVSF